MLVFWMTSGHKLSPSDEETIFKVRDMSHTMRHLFGKKLKRPKIMAKFLKTEVEVIFKSYSTENSTLAEADCEVRLSTSS